MAQPLRCGAWPPHRHQRGQALLIFLAIIAMGVIAVLYTSVRPALLSIEREEATAAALAQVKEALIGWSAARTPTPSNPNARPGELPCPDTDNNGFAENDDNGDGIDEANCVAGAIGRVPWKTLGIPEPKDSAGETLWYAISGSFRIYRNISPNTYTSPITSDTLGTLRVYQESTSNTITDQAVAVIFAPGAALGTQDRSTTATMSCAAPSGTYFRNQCAANYLETAAGVNNAALNGPYISAPSSGTFNDRVMVITASDLIPPVERRVAREMMSYVESYRIATGGEYPSADRGNGSSDSEYNRHRFPCATAIPISWGSGGSPTLPNWLTNGCGTNGWASVIFYAVSGNRLQGNTCSTCSGGTPCGSTTTMDTRLTITNASNRVADSCPAGLSPYACAPAVLGTGIANLLLITPGPATTNRASGWPSSLGPITGYFEDALNSDNDDGNCYVVPTSTSHDRDRMYVSIP